jgi:hypothetical protein
MAVAAAKVFFYVGSTYTMGCGSSSVACACGAGKSCPLMTLRMRRYWWANVLLVARQHSLVQLYRFDLGLLVMMSTTAAFGMKVQVVPNL